MEDLWIIAIDLMKEIPGINKDIVMGALNPLHQKEQVVKLIHFLQTEKNMTTDKLLYKAMKIAGKM